MHITRNIPTGRVPADVTASPGGVLVMGSGAVGCYIGGCLQAAGVPVTFVGRASAGEALQREGLRLTDLEGGAQWIPPGNLVFVTDIPLGVAPDLVLLCVKSAATADAAAQLNGCLPAGTVVLSLQNGVSNAQVAQLAAPDLSLVSGMVPYNIAQLKPGHFHRGTVGRLGVQSHVSLRTWQAVFESAGLPVDVHEDLLPVQWGKLLLNLNNPVNALSGLPLRRQLLQRGYRRVLAALIAEALEVLDKAGVHPAKVTPVAPRWLPALLRLPTPVFRIVAARMLRMDDNARSSMADDLTQNRPTEIDALCGEVVRLAAARSQAAPLNAAMMALVRNNAPHKRPLSARDMLLALG